MRYYLKLFKTSWHSMKNMWMFFFIAHNFFLFTIGILLVTGNSYCGIKTSLPLDLILMEHPS